MQAERLDGSVLLAGCDKSLPGMLMAAARLDLASVFLYAGSIAPGWVKLEDGTEKDVTIIDAFEAVGACARGLMSREDVDRIERAICPGEGACGGMYTANTMASVAEAIGMSLPGSAAPPSADRRRDAFAAQVRRGRRRAAPPGHHRAPDHDQGGVRERHRRRHGVRRLDQRGPAPAGHRARGRGRPHARRLLPRRRQGAAPGRPQAVRPLRHERRRPHRRRPRRHEGAARRGPAARRLPHRHRQDGRREPGRRRTRRTPTARSCARWTTRSTRPAASRSCTARSRPRAPS